MAFLGSRRSLMTLFSNKLCPWCHRVRIVLAEKGITPEIVEVDLENLPEELLELNPYSTVPTLVDRDLVLYEPNIILEYLEERFPHPPLMPVYPVTRARSRLMMLRIDRDWYAPMKRILEGKKDVQELARKELVESLLSISSVFGDYNFFLSEEFSLVDCSLAAMLWRLPALGIDLTKYEHAKPILKYMDRIFKRESFMQSLSDAEREMRPGYYRIEA
jgi:RNA polymerase-associated protein